MNTQDQKKLKAAAHSLKPTVMIGQKGLTEAVHAEIDLALNSHELIKIKIAGDKAARDALLAQITEHHSAEHINSIGHIVTIYRQKAD